MHTVFSPEDLPNPNNSFWATPPPSPSPSPSLSQQPLQPPSSTMNRSASEWAFERFLEEVSALPSIHSVSPLDSTSSPASQFSTSKLDEADDEVVEINKSDLDRDRDQPLDPSKMVRNNSAQFRLFLKNQLDIACAAAALTRAVSTEPKGSVHQVDDHGQTSKTIQLGSQVPGQAVGSDRSISTKEGEANCSPLGIPSLPAVPKKLGLQPALTTSGSSRDESDDDELDGDIENIENMDPSDARRARRLWLKR